MPTSAPQRPWLRATTSLLCMALGCVLLLAPVSAGADPAPLSPADPAQGFLVVVRGDAALLANESEGAVAVGGDLTWDQYQVALHTPGTYKVAPSDAQPTSLLVGGTLALGSSAGRLTAEQGWVAVGDGTGAEAKRQNPNQITVNATGAAADANPMVFGQSSSQALDTAIRPTGFDFEGAFQQWRAMAAALSACSANVAVTGANGPDQPWTPGQGGYVQSGATTGPMRLTLDASVLTQLPSLTFRPGYEPSASRPLVITVTSGNGQLTGWNPTLITGDANGFAPYVLWNFAGLTKVATTGGQQLTGTVLLPDGTLDHESGGNLVGAVYTDTFVHGGGAEVHQYPFATTVPGCTSPTTTTSSTTSSTSSTTSTTVPPTSSTSTSTTSTSTTSTSTTSTSTTVPPTSSTSTSTSTSTTSTTSTSTSTTSTSTTSTTVAPTTTSTTVAPTSTSTTSPSTTSTSTTSTTVPPGSTSSSVLPASTDAPTSTPPSSDGAEVAGASVTAGSGVLPYTGGGTTGTVVGLLLLGGGALLLALTARARGRS